MYMSAERSFVEKKARAAYGKHLREDGVASKVTEIIGSSDTGTVRKRQVKIEGLYRQQWQMQSTGISCDVNMLHVSCITRA